MPRILVLCYHAVSDDWDATLSVTPADLSRQLQRLLSQGWRPVRFTDAVLRPSFPKTLAVTFDDAFDSVRTRAMPILTELGVPATVFVATNWVGRLLGWPEVGRWEATDHAAELRSMSWEDLTALSRAGWEIGAHTRSHPHLPELPSHIIREELEGSRADCEQQLAQPCTSIAYPFGAVDDRIRAAAAAAGYRVAAGLSVDAFRGRDVLDWPRVGIWHGEPDWRFAIKTSPMTFAIRDSWWGHAADARRVRRGAHRWSPSPRAGETT